ncbi:ABC transporter permease [Runella sp. MFBS21]|uniref:ABC transporter permease n=1 Tax=Runella sp. MFBS21 TaxID=3034018 RepID=UPI0023F8BB2B|nr:ABC transporter permease [Runella sp. MFBS21]MDF7816360.1 ABC transporter permease [Runella sp. MFBS21]
MLFNYLKITLAVLKRRKFFTFISLFGISFTLTILVVATAFMDHLIAPGYPEINRDRSLYIWNIKEKDTKKSGQSSGPISFSFINKYVRTLKTPAKVAAVTIPNTINIYLNNSKLKLYYRYTDASFWDITSFDFLEGKSYTQQNIDNNDFVVVINDHVRDEYVGKGQSAVGKMIEIDNVNYRIIGVVRGCPITRLQVSSDLYFPYNTYKSDLKGERYRGSFAAIILPDNPADLSKIQDEFDQVASRLKPTLGDKWFNPDKIYVSADTYLTSFTRQLKKDGENSGKSIFFTILFGVTFLFMSLPAINLVNINLSRIMERASEIGIRKAFGASANTLVMQFIIENIILTLIGGIIAVFLSLGVIYYLNHSNLIAYIDLSFNWKVFSIALLISLIFGLLSGVYPAWRMSKLQVVEALKN